MQTGDSLYILIQAMTTAEKIHFKRSMKMQAGEKEPAYLLLFSVLEKLKEYNKEKIEKKLKEKGLATHLVKTRGYLYEFLLSFLEEYDAEKNIPKIATKMFRKAQLLYRKGMYDEAGTLLKKAKEMAETHQLFNVLVYIHTQELSLILNNVAANDRYRLMQKKHQEKTNAIYNISVINGYEEVFNLFHLLHLEAPSSRETDVLAEAHSLCEKITRLPDTIAFYPRLLQCLSYSMYYNITQNYKKMHENYEAAIQLYNENPVMKKKYTVYYINTIKNYLGSLHFYRKYADYPHLLALYTNFIQELDAYAKIFPLMYLQFLQLDILLTRADFDTALKFIEKNKLNEEPDANDIFSNSMLFKLYHQYACVLFMNGKYTEANKYINYLLNHFNKNEKIRNDLFFATKILKLIITYELSEYMLLEDLLNSTQRYFSRHNQLYELETILFNHFKELLNNNTEKKIWQQTKEKIMGFDPYFIQEFIGFDIVSWIDSKAGKHTLKEILKEKAEKEYPEIHAIDLKL